MPNSPRDLNMCIIQSSKLFRILFVNLLVLPMHSRFVRMEVYVAIIFENVLLY